MSFLKISGNFIILETIAVINITKIAFFGKQIISNKTVANGFLIIEETSAVVTTVTQKIGLIPKIILKAYPTQIPEKITGKK